MPDEHALVFDTPIGRLRLVASADGALARIDFHATEPISKRPRIAATIPALAHAVEELGAYFAGDLRAFTVPLTPVGTTFQLAVWEEVAKVPYGETATYGEIARRIGKSPGTSRAVGAANGQNPLPIMIPCHRIIGGNGDLTGYGGGLSIKEALLELEHRHHRPEGGQMILGA